jgi:predicted nucleotidyltransferase component of viral defense system
MPETTAEERQQVVQAIQDALQPFGAVRVRTWGDVVSVELWQERRVVFSFQVAHRSAQLTPPQPVPWTDTWLDSFPDLVAAKMMALVERGAPRDFRDIYTLCQTGATTAEQCWTLWQQRQQLAGSDTDAARARLAVQTHLTRIALHRPLNQIADPTERAAAEQVRTWFEMEFLNVLMD